MTALGHFACATEVMKNGQSGYFSSRSPWDKRVFKPGPGNGIFYLKEMGNHRREGELKILTIQFIELPAVFLDLQKKSIKFKMPAGFPLVSFKYSRIEKLILLF